MTKRLTIFVGATLLWLAVAAGTYAGWIHGADHRDLYPLWAGARFALLEGRDLYDPDTTLRIQETLYGGRLPPERDQQGFAYPAILVPLLIPFWLVPNVEVATAAWEATSVLMLLAALWLARDVRGFVPPWLLALLLIWFYPLLMIFQAQVTAIPLLSLALGFWAWRKNRDVLAGLALVPALIKPDLALIPILLLCGFALRERRWRMLGAFVGGGLALLMGSFAINGFWPPRWLDALGRYADYAQTVWPIGAAFEIQPLLGVVLIVVVGLALWRLRPHPISLFSLAVALGMLLLPQTPIWGQTLLLLPLALSGTRRGRWAVLGVWLAGWLLALLTTGNPGGWRLVTILLPVLTIGAVSLSSPDTPPEPAMHKQS
jgi:hypothetical protein